MVRLINAVHPLRDKSAGGVGKRSAVFAKREGWDGCIVNLSLCATTLDRKQALRSFLDKDHDKDEDCNFGEHSTGQAF